jgi:uncharacterized protein (UPF0332 family)
MSILLEKSENNRACANWAETNGYYHIAVSRLYYSIYQKIISSKRVGTHSGASSHFKTINEYFESLEDPDEFIAASIQDLRRSRNDADYKPNCFKSKSEFDDMKAIYEEVNEYLESID